MKHTAVLIVCLGNICRSPLAEAALRREAEDRGLAVTIESAGTGDWHVGKPPDPRTIEIALRNGIDICAYRARQATPEDFRRFDHIFALDHQNLEDLRAIRPADATASLSLLLDHVEGLEGQPVADPYFGEADGFAETWEQVSRAAKAVADKLATESLQPPSTRRA